MARMLQTLKLLEEAVNTGFAAALTIDSTSVEALLGSGDAHMAAGKLLASSGNLAIASTHWNKSLEVFTKASKLLAAGNSYSPYMSVTLGSLHQALLDLFTLVPPFRASLKHFLSIRLTDVMWVCQTWSVSTS